VVVVVVPGVVIRFAKAWENKSFEVLSVVGSLVPLLRFKFVPVRVLSVKPARRLRVPESLPRPFQGFVVLGEEALSGESDPGSR
jgi:hypothetical protein